MQKYEAWGEWGPQASSYIETIVEAEDEAVAKALAIEEFKTSAYWGTIGTHNVYVRLHVPTPAPVEALDRGELKMWLAVRRDLKMPEGKLATQAGHGYVSAIMDALRLRPGVVSDYMSKGQPKITVTVSNEDYLRRVHTEAAEASLPCSYIVDEGRTVFNEPTATVAAVGPCYRDELPAFIKRLRLL